MLTNKTTISLPSSPLSFTCFVILPLFHNALEAMSLMMTEVLMQKELMQSRKERRGGLWQTQSVHAHHAHVLPFRWEVRQNSLTPLLPWAASAPRPQCDTGSLRWECMSSVHRYTPGANKDVSALKHKGEVFEVEDKDAYYTDVAAWKRFLFKAASPANTKYSVL